MTKQELIDKGYEVFSEFGKPASLQEVWDLDPEGKDHEALLQSRERKTLQLDDVGSIGYNPITCITPEGMAYFMPWLLELAMDLNTESRSEAEPYLWAFILQIMPSSNEKRFGLFKPQHYCHVCSVLRYIEEHHMPYIEENVFEEEFESTVNAWCSKCA